MIMMLLQELLQRTEVLQELLQRNTCHNATIASNCSCTHQNTDGVQTIGVRPIGVQAIGVHTIDVQAIGVQAIGVQAIAGRVARDPTRTPS